MIRTRRTPRRRQNLDESTVGLPCRDPDCPSADHLHWCPPPGVAEVPFIPDPAKYRGPGRPSEETE